MPLRLQFTPRVGGGSAFFVMLSKPVGQIVLGVVAIGAVVWLFLHAILGGEVLAEYPWHLTGQVFDKATNALAGVNVTVSAMPRITGRNRITESPPPSIQLMATSDQAGRFALDFSAAAFVVRLSKTGYAEQNLPFGPWVEGHPGNSNQVLQAWLEPAAKPQ